MEEPMRMSAMAVAVLAFAACGRPAPPSFERPPAPVHVAAALRQDAPLYLDEIGRAVAREVVAVQPQVGGRITAVHVADGADVKTGDPLFTIDPRPYRAQFDEHEAALAQAKASLDLAKIEAERAESLVESKAISKQDVDARRNAVEIARARVLEHEAAVETARLNLEYCDIRSPIDGRAGHRLVDPGNIVSANGSPLLVIQRIDPIYADFTVTENALSTVQRHMQGRALAVEVRLPDDAEPLAGELTFLDNAVQDGTGRVKLRATVANPARRLWPGRFVRVRLVLDTLRDAVLVPAVAAQTSARGAYVYVVKDDATAEMRPVTLGQAQSDLVVVERGLSSGERVITNGHLGVVPGGKVRVDDTGGRP
jgi:multidrug efflux system membrane fusion protein